MPTIDPKDLPSSARAGSYEVSSFQTSLQRSFERWLESPSPTSERLVDQSLISAGREPMFSRGRATGQPASFPKPYTGVMARAPAFRDERGRFARQGFSGPGYAAPQFNGPSYAQQTATYRGAMPYGAGAYAETSPITAREATKLFKHIDQTLDSMNRVEHRILYLNETSSGRGGGTRGGVPFTRGSWIPGVPGVTAPFLAAGATPAGLRMPPMPPGAGGFGAAGGGVVPLPGAGGGAGGAGAAGAGGGGNAFQGGILGGALGRNGVWGAIAGEGAALAARWPLHLGHFEQGLLRASSPYTDWQSRIADVTALPASMEQSGGVRRTMLERSLLPYPGAEVPKWMSKLGITPTMGADILGRMGGGVQTGTDQLEMVQNFRNLRLGAGFRMAPEGSAEALGMMGQKYGITQPGGQAGFPGAFAQFMAQGQAGGADVKDLLRSIDESTESLVKTGIKLDLSQTTGWADFLQRMLTVNLPSAQSGQMGGQIVSGMQGAGQHPFANPVTATVFSQLINQTDWNDPQQVKKLLGKTPEEIMRGGADWEKTGLGMLQQGKTSPLAMLYGSRMISGNSEGLTRIGDVVGKMGGGGAQGDALRQMLMGSFLGQDFVTGSGALAGIKAQKQPEIPGATTPLPGTLPSEAFRSQTEAFTAVFRGMRTDFEEFGSRVHLINNLLDGTIDILNKLLGRQAPSGGAPGSSLPSGQSAPMPWLPGAGKTGTGAGEEYGTGQGTTPSGGTNIPKTAGRLGPQSFEAISRAEGTYGKNGINYNMLPGGGIDTELSNRTLAEAAGVSRKLGDGVGGFQIIGSNIIAGARALGLDPNTTKFTPEVQQQIASWVHDKQGVGAWHGFRAHPEELERFKSGLTSPDKEPGNGQGKTSMSPAGGGGKFSWGSINPLGISSALADTLPLSASALPPGYTLQGTSGHRLGDSGFHGRGLAADFHIVDPSGNVIENRGGDSTGMYTKWAHGWYNAVLQKHPELADRAEWGGEFGTQKGGGGPDDLMHVDLGGRRGSRVKSGWAFSDPNALSARLADDAASAEHGRSGVAVERRGSGGPVDKHDEDTSSPGKQGFNWEDIHDAVGFLGRMARETGEHLSDLGHGARSARSGLSGKTGPNASTSPTPNPAAAAYP